MTNQQNFDVPSASFAVTDLDGLILDEAIHRFVIGPDLQELCRVIGATRADGWVWLRPEKFNPKLFEDGEAFDDENYSYEPLYEDGTFVAFDSIEGEEILRHGIAKCRCNRVSPKLESGDPNSLLDLLAVLNARGIGPLKGFGLEWSVDISIEELSHVIKSWSGFAQVPPAFNEVKTAAKNIGARWKQLFSYVRQGALAAVGVQGITLEGTNNGMRERLTLLQMNSFVDLRSGNVRQLTRKTGWGEPMISSVWGNVMLIKPETPSTIDPIARDEIAKLAAAVGAARRSVRHPEKTAKLVAAVGAALRSVSHSEKTAKKSIQDCEPKLPTKAAGPVVEEWLMDLIKSEPTKPPKRDDVTVKACFQFRISRRQFDAVWSRVTRIAREEIVGCKWGRPGRHSKARASKTAST
jgi:hypothetical protein